MKKAVSLWLVLALCVGLLSGCGGGQPAQPEQTAIPEEVWGAAFQKTSFPDSAQPSLWALTDSAVYAACREKIADGEIPEGKTPDYEGEYDVMGWRLYRLGPDGAAERLADLALSAPEDTEGRENYSASADLQGLFSGPDGGLLAVERSFEVWGAAGREETRGAYALRYLDADGRELSRVPLGFEGDYLSVYSAVTDSEGRLYVPSDGNLLIYDGSGEPAVVETDSWIYNTVRLADGRAAVGMWNGGMRLSAVNAQTRTLEEIALLDSYPEELIPGGGDYDFYYTAGTKLYGFRLGEQEAAEVLDWLSCDLSAHELRAVLPLADGSLRGVYQENSRDAAAELVTVSKAPRDAANTRAELTLGTLTTYGVSDAVLRFNRRQDRVRIRLLDYSDFVNGEDYEAGLTKLVTEITAGNMPDLLALDNLPYAQLAARGLLEDLYPYLDADEELSREDFFENVLRSMEVGGKLCEVSPGFSILTAMGASEVVGDTPGWTYEEFDAALASMPEGCTPFGPQIDRDSILEMCIYLNLGRFVDWGRGTCDFEREGFQRMLEFCAQFPTAETMAYDEGSSDMLRIAEGQQMLVFTNLYDMDEAVYNDQYFAGTSTYIGFPTEEGVGSVLNPSAGYAMSSHCADKDAAWQFLRGFLTEEGQGSDTNYSGGLPFNRAAFQKALDKAMQVEYETDAEGHYLLDANGERIEASKGGMGVSVGGDAIMEFELWAMTPTQAEKLTQLIESCTMTLDLNTALSAIIKEEAAAYFAGQKSAEEVARLVQSKASLYLSEQR